MKMKFDVAGRHQPDPYIFADGGKLYLYVTGSKGVEAYSADALDGVWHYEGIICTVEGGKDYWAPAICKVNGKYYLYFSCTTHAEVDAFEYMYAAEADTPLGPFGGCRRLFDRFTIDAHVVETSAGLFLFYAEDNREGERIGTRVFVDKLLDPYTPANLRRELLVPTFDEEIFKRNRFGDGKDWHTLEGPFWFEKDGWQYLMYSGACYGNDSYHIGYAAAKSDERDLCKVDFVKHTKDGAFDPLMIKNEVEEGTGHHSVIELDGQLYIVYHGRDLDAETAKEGRTGRFCKLFAKDGILTVERI